MALALRAGGSLETNRRAAGSRRPRADHSGDRGRADRLPRQRSEKQERKDLRSRISRQSGREDWLEGKVTSPHRGPEEPVWLALGSEGSLPSSLPGSQEALVPILPPGTWTGSFS